MGGGQLASVDGPFTNDAISYQYDVVGRLQTNTIAGITSTLNYDPLGRIQTLQNPMGYFTYNYQANSWRLDTIHYPGNTLTADYQHHGADQQRRLEQLGYQNQSGQIIAQHHYNYNEQGQITSWQQTGNAYNPEQQWNYQYDKSEQLSKATLINPINPLQALESYRYHYDAAGNRIGQQHNTEQISQAGYNDNNQLLNQQAGGLVNFRGLVNKPTSVQINGQNPASTDANNRFQDQAQLQVGSNLVAITLQDSLNQKTTNHYQIQVAETVAQSYHYDANGNLLSRSNANGLINYQWDGAGRLVQIQSQNFLQSTNNHTTLLAYDGQNRLIQIQEQDASGVVSSDKQLLWSGNRIARSIQTNYSDGPTLSRWYFAHGFREQTNNGSIQTYYTLTDHLSSVRQVTDPNGNLISSYNYDPYGQNIQQNGSIQSDFAYAGYYFHQPSGLYLTKYRAYDPALARWFSRDPLREIAGLNLYAYVNNNPINYNDPLGLVVPAVAVAAAATITAADIAVTVYVSIQLYNLYRSSSYQPSSFPIDTAQKGIAAAYFANHPMIAQDGVAEAVEAIAEATQKDGGGDDRCNELRKLFDELHNKVGETMVEQWAENAAKKLNPDFKGKTLEEWNAEYQKIADATDAVEAEYNEKCKGWPPLRSPFGSGKPGP